MKVVHFKKTFLNPTETFVYNQIISLNGVENFVMCREKNENSGFDLSLIPHIDEIPYSVNYQFQKYLFAVTCAFGKCYPINQQKMVDNLRLSQPDLIHAHFGPDANYILPVTRKLGIPLITSFYGYDVSSFPKEYFGLAKRAYRNLAKEGTLFLAMSEDMKNNMVRLGFPEEKIVVHYFGINTSFFASRKRDYSMNKGKIKLIQVASLIEKKGHFYLLQVLDKLIHEYGKTNVSLDIIGTGPLEAKLRSYVEKRGMEKFVRFVGFVQISEKYLDYLYDSHIYIHHSVTDSRGAQEGIPTTVVEAAASGLPVISTCHAGIPDIVKHGVNGFLTKEKDVDLTAKYLAELIEDDKLREKLGKAGRQIAEQKLDNYKKSVELNKIYDKVISNKFV